MTMFGKVLAAQRKMAASKPVYMIDGSGSRGIHNTIEIPTAHPDYPKYRDTGWHTEVPAKACLVDVPNPSRGKQ